MANITTTTNEAGDVFVGFDADGTFIPFASVPASRIAQLQERAAGLSELAKADDPGSQNRHAEAANSLPYSTKGASSKGGAS